ncbi:MAG: DUF3108 domain-containing protein [Bacteroidota bacterium]
MKKSKFRLLFGAVSVVIVLSSFDWISPLQENIHSHPYALSEGHYFKNSLGKCYAENKTFKDGERLTYKLFYKLKFLWIPAGEVIFEVTDNQDGTLHLSAKGRTYRSYEWFFKVRNSYECTIDKETLLPNHSLRKIREGKNRRVYENVIFDQEDQKAISQYGRSEETAKENQTLTQDCIHDLLSVLYYTRNINLEQQVEGSKFPIKVFMDQKVQSLNLIYHGKEKRKKIKGRGRFNTIHFRPESMPGPLFDKAKDKGKAMNIWVSDDQNRLPLMIRTPLAGGQIKAILKKYEGLRYELSAKVK